MSGGLSGSNSYLKTCELYDPSTGTWSSTGAMNSKRTSFYATKLANGNVLYAGGNNISGYMDSCEIYDANSSSWISTAKLNTKRDAPYTLLNDGKVFISAGYNGSSLSSNELFTPSNTNHCKTPLAPSISASYSNICLNQSTILSIASGQLDSATHWQWYSNSCGGTALDTTSSITVSPQVTTTYFAHGEGGCVSAAPCANITITVHSIPVITPVQDLSVNTPAGLCKYPVNFSANASGSLNPQIKFYLQDVNNYEPYEYEVHSGELFAPFYAYAYPTPATINVIATNVCGSDTDQFVITMHAKRFDITCPGIDTFMLDSGETTYTDYTNGHGYFPGTHLMLDAQILNYCGFGGGPYYKFSGATVSARFIKLHETPLNVGTTRVVAFAYDEYTGFFLDEYLFDTIFNDSMLHVWADSCVFYITVVERPVDLINCIANQSVNANYAGNKFKVLNKDLDPIKLMNKGVYASLTNNFNNDTTIENAQFSNGTTRILWSAIDTANHIDTCSFSITVNHCDAGVPTGSNVFSGNKTISTQTQLNAFFNGASGANNGNKYTKITGSLYLDGGNSSDPITNFCNLSALTEITGTLEIKNFNKTGNPDNLVLLENLSKVGCWVNIVSNPKLNQISLPNLTTVGCSFKLDDNANATSIQFPRLQSIQGDKLVIKNHPKLETLSISNSASSFNFTGRGSNVEVSDNGNSASGNLTMNLKKIIVIKGALIFTNNDNAGVNNFDNIFTGLTDLSTKWGKLIITNNDYLGTCCIAASVNVGGSGNRHIISGNTGNCIDSATVLANCGVFHKKSMSPSSSIQGSVKFNVYPSPNSGLFNLDVMSNQSGNLNLIITDLMGRQIFSETYLINQFTSLPISLTSAATGIYFLKADLNGEVFVKRISIVK